MEPTPAADSAVARSRNVPEPVESTPPTPTPTPTPIQLELPDEIAQAPAVEKAPTPPAPRQTAPAPAAEPAGEPEDPAPAEPLPDAASLAPAFEPETPSLDDPALDLPALPAELTEGPANAGSDLPGLPAELPAEASDMPELPAEVPAMPELPAEPSAEPEAAPTPSPAPAPAPAEADVEEPAAAQEPLPAPDEPRGEVEEPAPAAEEAMPAPAPTQLPDLTPAPARAVGSGLVPAREAPKSTLSPELERQVAEIAAAQEERAFRDRIARQTPPALPGGIEERPDDPISDSRMQTQIDISRAPSPAEARPISAVPVPEDWVPLGAREWSPQRKYWAAAATCHLPLYFQDPMLERYGHSVENYMGPAGRFFAYPVDNHTQSTQRNQILQPFASVGQFAFQILTLPYAMVVDPPWESQYDLGYWRPGDKIPTDMYYLPVHGTGPALKGSKY
jgi:hypothetical protein